jgi:alpha-galactosidase
MIKRMIAAALMLLLAASVPAQTVKATASEMREAHNWFKTHLEGSTDQVPFRFTVGGKPLADLLPHCVKGQSRTALNGEKERSWRDPKTGLQIIVDSVEQPDYPVVAYTIYLINSGSTDTPIIADLNALDITLPVPHGTPVLHGIRGDDCTAHSYEPFDLPLTEGFSKGFSPPGSGKSCDGADGWPYFNLQMPGGGLQLAVGWPGQWAASWERTHAGVHITAGLQKLHTVLHPAERIRSPRIELLFWQGTDTVRSQNLWRRYYMAHILPEIQGKKQQPLAQIQVDGSVPGIEGVDAVLKAGIHPDVCWRDAGGTGTWYPSASGPYKGNDVWLNTGTWEVDLDRLPQGFKPFSSYVRSKGMQFLLWFEPERVGDPNSWLGKNHPEWLLPGSSHGGILNLGDNNALLWLTDHIDHMITEQGLDWYREDMNGVGPGPAWRKNEAPDRVGAIENHYVQGHLAFWDALRTRNPALHIDSCASGGRRNDLETMRRGVPLLRSDFQFPEMPEVIEGNQAQTWSLSRWLPYQGTGCYFPDLYALRSFYLPAFGTVGESALQKQAYDECARLAPLMLADYYPLTNYSRSLDSWIAWEWNQPESGKVAIQAFRRKNCAESSLTVKLQGLNPHKLYTIENADTHSKEKASGKELMETGLKVEIPSAPGSALLFLNSERRRERGK